MDWAKNGESAGTLGYAYRLEGIEIKLVEKEENAPGKTDRPYVKRIVKYSGYQNSTWQTNYDNTVIGKAGSKLESIKLTVLKDEYDGGISYSTYLTEKGWQNYVSNERDSNQIGNKIEAIKIKLTGEVANHYDVYYSVYVSDTGWTGWSKNDSPCGNIGNFKYIQAYRVKVVEKEEPSPGSEINNYTEANMSVMYSSYVKGDKWQNYMYDGNTSGTTGQAKPIRGIKININKRNVTGDIQYSTHVSHVGWQNYVSNNSQAGNVVNNIEAIKIKLTDDLANHYDIYYRVHVSDVGWMAWTSNDQPAGTSVGGRSVEAIEIKIIEKGGQAPANDENTRTVEAYLEARWETDEDGNKYFYDVFGNQVKGGSYKMGDELYYFGPTGIYLGNKNLEILDISAWNGNVDWKKVAGSGIYGVILRVAASSVVRDTKLPANIEGVKKYGIPYGIYIYSYAENYSEGVDYANYTKELMDEFDIHPTLGIFLDLESNNDTKFMGPTEYTAVVKGFLSVIPEAEVYTYTYYAETALNTPYIRNKITWIADYRGYVGYTGNYRMWQYTEEGRNPGVNGDVDRSILYRLK